MLVIGLAILFVGIFIYIDLRIVCLTSLVDKKLIATQQMATLDNIQHMKYEVALLIEMSVISNVEKKTMYLNAAKKLMNEHDRQVDIYNNYYMKIGVFHEPVSKLIDVLDGDVE